MSRLRIFTAACAALVLASPLAAQSLGRDSSVAPTVASAPIATPGLSVERTVSLGPTQMNAAAGLRVVTAPNTNVPAPLPSEDTRNPAMMIVGGVALVAGSFVERPAGPMIMIGGALLGLYGLWQYLK